MYITEPGSDKSFFYIWRVGIVIFLRKSEDNITLSWYNYPYNRSNMRVQIVGFTDTLLMTKKGKIRRLFARFFVCNFANILSLKRGFD